MSNTEKYLNAKELPAIILIYGEEESLMEDFFVALTKKFINKENEYDSEILDAETIDLNKLIDSLNSYPFITDTRIVFCKNFDSLFPATRSKKNEEKNPFFKYLDNPLKSTKLVALCNPKYVNDKPKKIDTTKFPFNTLTKKYDSVEFPMIWESDFPKFIVNTLKAQGRTIEQSAIELLVNQTSPNIRSIKNELEKLIIFSDTKLFITYEDVINITGVSRNFNVFELQKSIGRRDIDKSIEIIVNMLSYDRQEVLILTIMTRFFISLLKLYELSVTIKDKYVLAPKIGVSPYFLNDYLSSLNLYSIKDIENAIILISEIDLKLKSTSTNGVVLLETLLVNILSKKL
jgi:DNA polymerase-3 subunit delta